MSMRELFNNKVLKLMDQKRSDNKFTLTRERYNSLIASVKHIKAKQKKAPGDYRKIARYDVLVVENGQEKLIKATKGSGSNTVFYVATDELFDVLHETHLEIGHGGRNRMTKELKNKYNNITKEIVMTYLSCCEKCRQKKTTKERALKSPPHEVLNSRGHLDFIAMQPYHEYRFVLVYQDHLTKFLLLKPLQTKSCEEVARNVLDIFTTIGIPAILQLDDRHNLSNNLINKLHSLWSAIKIVQNKADQNSMEKTNRDIHEMLTTWMVDQKSPDWTTGLKIVQFTNNRTYQDDIKTSPFEAMFRCTPKLGLSSFPENVVLDFETNQDFERANSNSPNAGPSTDMDYEEAGTTVIKEENCVVCEKPSSNIQFCVKCGELIDICCGTSAEGEDSDSKRMCPLCFPKWEFLKLE